MFLGVASAGAALLASLLYTRAKTRKTSSKRRTKSEGQSIEEHLMEEFRAKFAELKQAFLEESELKHEMPPAAIKRLDRVYWFGFGLGFGFEGI